MAPAMFGVPASNLSGAGRKVVRRHDTFSIMSPPPWYGGMESSRLRRAMSTPIPVGPKHLWPESEMKSQGAEEMSSSMCGADWAASTEKTEPFCRAISPIAAMSFTVPSTFEACATETIFVFGESLFLKSSMSSEPSPSIPAATSFAPVRSAAICHGTMLAWCSMAVTRISSPLLRFCSPHEHAARLRDSVAPRVNTAQYSPPAPKNFSILARESSYPRVARPASSCAERCMLALSRE